MHRWDQLVQHAPNARVYAESWYLDILNPDWMGLIYGDYEYGMPIIQGRKWGISYVFQPTFAQQHGIFPPATAQITAEMLAFLSAQYAYINLSVNSMNVQVGAPFKVQQRKNYLLSLHEGYNALKLHYTQHTKRYLKRAKAQCTVMQNLAPESYLALKQQYAHRKLSKSQMAKLKLIVLKALTMNRGVIYGAYSKHNELVAAAFFLKDQKRVVYLNGVSNSEGKESRAMMALIDQMLADFAGSNYLLDFEGSNIPGVARFFEGFGAKAETYQHLQYNALPWYLKLLKR